MSSHSPIQLCRRRQCHLRISTSTAEASRRAAASFLPTGALFLARDAAIRTFESASMHQRVMLRNMQNNNLRVFIVMRYYSRRGQRIALPLGFLQLNFAFEDGFFK
jgi:hypothetical protein